MGDIAEMMLDGTMCSACGGFMGGAGNGYPVTCLACAKEEAAEERDPLHVGVVAPGHEIRRCRKQRARRFYCTCEPGRVLNSAAVDRHVAAVQGGKHV